MKHKLKKNCTICNSLIKDFNSIKLKKLPITEVLLKKRRWIKDLN